MPREIDCAICEKPVAIPSKKRFLAMIRENRNPLCQQCRRYACERLGGAKTAGSARNYQTEYETEVTARGLLHKRGRHAKNRQALASHKLKRFVRRGCEPCRDNE